MDKYYLIIPQKNFSRYALLNGIVSKELLIESSNGNYFFNEIDTSKILNSENLPANILAIELIKRPENLQSYWGWNDISNIHFSSIEDIEDLLSRGYENSFIEQFVLVSNPALFTTDTDEQIDIKELPRISKDDYFQQYRTIDALLAVINDVFEKDNEFLSKFQLLSSVYRMMERGDLEPLRILHDLYLSNTTMPIENESLSSYIDICIENIIDNGWVRKSVFNELTLSISEKAIDEENSIIWHRWKEYVNNLLNEKAILPKLEDKEHLVLRAIMLHILNPTSDSLNIMEQRDIVVGSKIMKLAKQFSMIREGYSRLTAVERSHNIARANFLNDFAVSLLSNKPLDINNYITISWNKDLVENSLISEDKTLINSNTGSQTESKIEVVHLTIEDEDVYKYLQSLEGKISAIKKDDFSGVNFKINKSRILSLIKIEKTDGSYKIKGRLLDLKKSSHKTKLSGNLMKEMYRKQVEFNSNKRYELDDDGLWIVILLNISEASLNQNIDDIINMMTDFIKK